MLYEVITVFILLYGIGLVEAGEITVGSLVAFLV